VASPKFTSRSYYDAAREHLGLAARLREEGEHFAAHYFAGIAVESILRSLCVKDGGSADRTHDITHWAAKANLMFDSSINQQDNYRAQISELNLRWRANHRYCTAKMLDTWLHEIDLDGRVGGDRTKNNSDQVLRRVKISSERMLELSNAIVSIGVQRWNKKS